MRQATKGEVCRDAGKTVRISVAVPSTAGFDHLLLRRRQFAAARASQKGGPGLKIAGNLANVGKQRLAAALGRFAASGIGVDVRNHAAIENCLPIEPAIVDAVQAHNRPLKLKANRLGNAHHLWQSVA